MCIRDRGMSQYVVLLQWLDEVHRYPWPYYLKACSPVEPLRHFIDTKLIWYLGEVDHRISNAELKSLLKVVQLLGEQHWEGVLSIRDEEERRQALLQAANIGLKERRKALEE